MHKNETMETTPATHPKYNKIKSKFPGKESMVPPFSNKQAPHWLVNFQELVTPLSERKACAVSTNPTHKGERPFFHLAFFDERVSRRECCWLVVSTSFVVSKWSCSTSVILLAPTAFWISPIRLKTLSQTR